MSMKSEEIGSKYLFPSLISVIIEAWIIRS